MVVAVEGQELNRMYRRTSNGLTIDREIVVEPGRGVALMPDDIHSIHTTGSTPTRHLHMYGLALEALATRMVFDPATGEAITVTRSFLPPVAPPAR